MKSYTDLEQSEKLAEILPLESADYHYIAQGEKSYFYPYSLSSDDIKDYDEEIKYIPCWSLAALLKIIGHYTLQTVSKDKKVFIVSEEKYPICSDAYSEPIDACIAMVEKLKELNLL